MTVITSVGVSSNASQQANRLALLTKLFNTTGKKEEDVAKAEEAPPPPAQVNSAEGLASMYAALESEDGQALPGLLQALDTDGDGTVSAEELQAFTDRAVFNQTHAGDGAQDEDVPGLRGRDFASLDADSDGKLSVDEVEIEPKDQPAQDEKTATGRIATTTSAYEALFSALQQVFAQATNAPGTSSSQRYANLLQSLAKAG